MTGIQRALLALAVPLVAPAASAADTLEYEKTLVEYGVFDHYHYGPTTFGMVVFSPASPPPNGATLFHAVSGGFGSPDVDDLFADEDYALSVRPFLERGYTVVGFTHGSIAQTFGPLSERRPGWVITQINEQAARAMRVYKSMADQFGVDPDRICGTGGSSGGGIALGWAVGGVGDPSAPGYDPAIDSISSRSAATIATSTGGSAAHPRIAEQVDPWYFWTSPSFVLHPDLSGLGFAEPENPLADALCPGIDLLGALWLNDQGDQAQSWFPQPNWDPVTYELGPPESAPYPEFLCPDFIDYIEQTAPLTRLDASVGPLLLIHGSDDHIVDINQFEMLEARAAELSLDFTGFVLEGEGHGWRDNRSEGNALALDFLDAKLLGLEDADGDDLEDVEEIVFGSQVDDPDTDGDGQNDWEERAARTDPQDPYSALRVASLVSTPDAAGDGWDLALTFDSVAGVSYRLQAATTIHPFPQWKSAPSAVVAAGASTTLNLNEPLAADAGAHFFRVAVDAVHPTVATPAWALLTVRVSRSAGGPRVNVLTPPLDPARLVQAEVALASLTGLDLQPPAAGDPGLGALSPDADGPTHLAMLVRDQTHMYPISNPYEHGQEGQWWTVTNNGPASVKLALRPPDTDLAAIVPLESDVLVRPLSSLADFFGPLPDLGDPSLAPFFGLTALDVVRVESPTSLGPAHRVSKHPAGGWQWQRQDAGSGAWSFIGDGSSVRLTPNDVVVVTAAAAAADTFVTVVGEIPTSDVWAYLERASAPYAQRLNVAGWPFPVGVSLYPVNQGPGGEGGTLRFATSNLVPSGFLLNTSDLFDSDYLEYTTPGLPAYAGDDFGFGVIGALDRSQEAFFYWLKPWPEDWVFVDTFISAANQPLLPGRALRLRLGTGDGQAGGGFVWKRKLPYAR